MTCIIGLYIKRFDVIQGNVLYKFDGISHSHMNMFSSYNHCIPCLIIQFL